MSQGHELVIDEVAAVSLKWATVPRALDNRHTASQGMAANTVDNSLYTYKVDQAAEVELQRELVF